MERERALDEELAQKKAAIAEAEARAEELQERIRRESADAGELAKTHRRASSAGERFDGATLLSLAPESMAAILQVSGTDPRVTEYVARSLMLASAYLREAGEDAVADLRLGQARALADAYGLELPDDPAEMAGLLDDVPEPAIVDIASADDPRSPSVEAPESPTE